jgi:hypothetical protein
VPAIAGVSIDHRLRDFDEVIVEPWLIGEAELQIGYGTGEQYTIISTTIRVAAP